MTINVDTKFNFKARTVKDANGAVMATLKKQPSVIVTLPFLTADEVVAILNSDDVKAKDLVLDCVNSAIKDQARSQFDELIESFGDDDSRTVSGAQLDLDKLTFSYIANLPLAQRGARALSDEDFAAFFTDYTNVMVATTGKPIEKIKKHIELFKKPARVKAAKDVLAVLVEQLDIYLVSSTNLEETGEAANRIRTRFDKWLKAEEEIDLNAL
jgi:ABC-type transporter MlaC component